MKSKKLHLLLSMLLCMLLCLCACAGEQTDAGAQTPKAEETKPTQAGTEQPEAKPSEAPKQEGPFTLGEETFDASVTMLDLGMEEVSDISVLANCTELEALNLMSTDVTDITPLAGLVKLKELYLSFTGIADISPLAGLQELQMLGLEDTSVTDYSVLTNFPNLIGITVSDIEFDEILQYIDLKSFRGIHAKNCGISDLTPFQACSALEELAITGDNNALDNDDLPALVGLTELKVLTMTGTQADDLSVLAPLADLQRLDLSQSNITQLKGLEHFTGLQNLSLEGTAITDISFLQGHVSLRYVSLNGDVSNLSVFESLPALIEIYLHGDEPEASWPDIMQLEEKGISVWGTSDEYLAWKSEQ